MTRTAVLWADSGSRHPLAHHTVDVVTKTADGWRIAERVAVLRRADRIREIC